MNSTICTLFEGHYHLGLAGLVNSVYRNGYRGEIYAGYKGELPPWAVNLSTNSIPGWEGSSTYKVAEGLVIHFLQLETGNHFANFKPNFMLKLWEGPASYAKTMFYFDPDIVIARPWPIFEEWATCGIALSEDVNSPLENHHPRRVAWRRYFGEKGIKLNFKNHIYVNSGFVGLMKENSDFLELWKKMQDIMGPIIGGLDISIFKKNHYKLLEQVGGPFKPFLTADQDALNIAIEVSDHDISYMGKNGMGFSNGEALMYHSIGSPKPWRWNAFLKTMDGRPPRKVDVEYWNAADGPILVANKLVLFWKKFLIKMSIGIGRFYRRN